MNSARRLSQSCSKIILLNIHIHLHYDSLI
nr:MAG TPA: hypothetical protein [Caudoviricetes sp.]